MLTFKLSNGKRIMIDPKAVVAIEEYDEKQTKIVLANGTFYMIPQAFDDVEAPIVAGRK